MSGVPVTRPINVTRAQMCTSARLSRILFLKQLPSLDGPAVHLLCPGFVNKVDVNTIKKWGKDNIIGLTVDNRRRSERVLLINRARNLICTRDRPLAPNFKRERPGKPLHRIIVEVVWFIFFKQRTCHPLQIILQLECLLICQDSSAI